MRHLPLLVLTLGLTIAGCSSDEAKTPQAQADAIAEQLGSGWDATVVNDPRDGDFVLASPRHAEVWTVGQPSDALASLTADTAWGGFWLPAIESAASDSNIRAVVADTRSLPGTVVSWQVNVNSDDPGLDLGPDELADDLRTRFTAQDLEVVEARTTTWNEREIALVAFEVPAEVFGGEERYVRQWFIPEDEPAAMWSFSCDAPRDPDLSTEVCRTGLDGFRITGTGTGTAAAGEASWP